MKIKNFLRQTYDRRIVMDDEITTILTKSHSDSHVTIISDCCHSGTMIDWIDRKRHKYQNRNWISIGSALDNQSAIQSGDGSICSFNLFKIINENPKISIEELKVKLKSKMENSFVGTIVHVSNNNIWKQKLFS